MAGTDRLTLAGWHSHWCEPGGLFVLRYRPPLATVCKNDGAAYRKILAVRGVTGITAGLATPPDTPRSGHERVPCYVCQPPERWEAWIIVTKSGTLGTIVQERILPCDGVAAAYELESVQRVMWDSNILLRSFSRIGDAIETVSGEIVKVARAPGESLARGVSNSLTALVDQLLPLTIPLLIAGVVYFQVVKRGSP
jgi:hypothetical protein